MRIRKCLNQFSPAPDLLSSTTVQPPPTMLDQEQNSRAFGSGEQSNESSSSERMGETSSGSSSFLCEIDYDKIRRKKRKVELESESRCSRKNGTGWRCRKERQKGHSLCNHHVRQSRHWKRLNIHKLHDHAAPNCFRVVKRKQRMIMITTLLNRPLPLLPNPTP